MEKSQRLILKSCSRISSRLQGKLEKENQVVDDYLKHEILSDIKRNFVERDYMKIFLNSPLHLYVYFISYVPSRALAYFEIFSQESIVRVLSGKFQIVSSELQRRRAARNAPSIKDPSIESSTPNQPPTSIDKIRILCIGAGPGSEQIAISHVLKRELLKKPKRAADISLQATFSEFQDGLEGLQVDKVEIESVDIGDWDNIQSVICKETSRPPFTQFTFKQLDVLNSVDKALFLNRNLITFMFVLNELFKVSKLKTVEMLTDLIQKIPPGTHLLFVESAGSFSELQVGSKDFKVYQLLDGIKSLDLVHKEDSKWFRYSDDLKSEFPLQNMRYFMRLYNKVEI